MSSACARPANGIKARHKLRRVRTTCTEFSFQIVHFLDRLSCLHQRIFGRTPREREAFRPNVHATCSRRFPQSPPKVSCREGGVDVHRRSLIHTFERTTTPCADPIPPLSIHGRMPPADIAGGRTRSGAVATRAAESPPRL